MKKFSLPLFFNHGAKIICQTKNGTFLNWTNSFGARAANAPDGHFGAVLRVGDKSFRVRVSAFRAGAASAEAAVLRILPDTTPKLDDIGPRAIAAAVDIFAGQLKRAALQEFAGGGPLMPTIPVAANPRLEISGKLPANLLAIGAAPDDSRPARRRLFRRTARPIPATYFPTFRRASAVAAATLALAHAPPKRRRRFGAMVLPSVPKPAHVKPFSAAAPPTPPNHAGGAASGSSRHRRAASDGRPARRQNLNAARKV